MFTIIKLVSLDSQSAADTIKKFDASHLATNYACEIPFGDDAEGKFNPDEWMTPKDRRKVDASRYPKVLGVNVWTDDKGLNELFKEH